MQSTNSANVIGHSNILPWQQLSGFSVTRPLISPQRVWYVRLEWNIAVMLYCVILRDVARKDL